ncbi:50S ribosomal protein L2 [Candidatus Absconditicoccus praedator]|uniref:50S ribosomal protein L2 n=1 Tax=Candidatus Absconditicoccus praedator TaxID=2735562 RepID=UPI001E65178E|nr:50S ribosomal protein L2 [Candidatus Absconditicoccus praedator]
MNIKTYKPYTPSRRYMTGYDFSKITKKRPEKKLVKFIGSKGGRNQYGRTTVRFRGGGHKKLYRIIDFKGYDKLDVPGKVEAIEYDPYRAARIALVAYSDGEKRYNIAWKGVEVGDEVMNSNKPVYKEGNRKQLKNIPEGFSVFNLEYTPYTKGKLVRSAGNYATIIGKDEHAKTVFVKLASGEIRKFNENCWATIGQVSTEEHKNIVLGKAGRSRWLGRRPKVRGKAMNPVDHPHGGGEGGTDIALKYPKSFTGRPVPPYKKTRKKKKWSDKFIVSRRTKN